MAESFRFGHFSCVPTEASLVNVNRLWITDIEKYVKSGFKFVRNINPQRYFINGAHKMLKTVDNTQKYYEFYDCGYVVLKLENNKVSVCGLAA